MKPSYCILFAAYLVFSGCRKEDDGGSYYELSFTDATSSIVGFDSIYVVLTQSGLKTVLKEVVPYKVTNNPQLGDTIKLKLEVNFGSSSQAPSPNKDIVIRRDTLNLWYSASLPPYMGFGKTHSLLESEAEPKVSYYSVQSVEIFAAPNKQIFFQSLIY